MIPHVMSSRQALFARFCRKPRRFCALFPVFSLPLPLLTRFFRFRTPLPCPALAFWVKILYAGSQKKRSGGNFMKIMAIDYGDAHTGVAISDRTLTLT